MIVVIGAGLAGLACARELHDAGREVVVLEARDRLGGRAWTDTSLGLPVDLGASWIHGHRRNPLWRLARKHDIPTELTDYEALGLYDERGRLPAPTAREAIELAWWLYEWAERLCHRHPREARDISLAAAMGRDLGRGGGLDLSEPRSFDWALNALKLDEGIDAAQLSLRYFEDDAPFGGDDYFLLDGFRRVVRVLARELDVRTGCVVERITWREGEGASVHTAGEVFEAEQVVVTLPLGVLAAGDVAFEPALPGWKQEAIERLGVGVLDKIVLAFDEVFWRREDTIIARLHEPRRAAAWVLNLHAFTGRPLLVGFLGGDEAREAERSSDEELVAAFIEDLREIFADRDVPEPTDWLVTRWAQDPFARGAYAHIPVGSSGAFYDRLAEPVGEGALLFAGEATCRDHPATAHGALISGRRAAEEILRG